jgi:hypothetical protein
MTISEENTTKKDTKQGNLAWYIKHGFVLLPLHWVNGGQCSCRAADCKSPGKHPLTPNGLHDATNEWGRIQDWHKHYPDANWGARTGAAETGGSDIVVIDIDRKSSGFETWDLLREEHSEPVETVTVSTGNNGLHLFFKYPAGHIVKSGTNVLGPGVDIRAIGGYIVIPPSVTTKQYTFEQTPADYPIAELPGWVLAKIAQPKRKEPADIPEPEAADEPARSLADDFELASRALNALSKDRADDYDQWLEVGMSLYKLGQAGLILWDTWSKQSAKYEPGICAQKWATITPAEMDARKISFGSLIYWAETDGCAPFVRPCPKDARPSDYKKALLSLGYKFTLNEMNDEVHVNGTRMTDLFWSKVMNSLRENKYKAENYATDSANELALDNQFHPIKDYLNSIDWMGMQENGQFKGFDFIGQLASYVKDKDDIFPLLLRKWLIGAVARILGPRPGEQHPMLVFDGPQGIGKSRFVWWLGTPLPAFYLQSAIITDDKDFLIRLCSTWVWEVEELGATFRKSDLESLKSFLSREVVKVRVPYGKRDIIKPATASFIGTINNSGGFLADPTGNRRFRVCSLTSIDWDYDRTVDVNQVWAQAVALYRSGESYMLDRADQERINEVNSAYEVDDPIAYSIIKAFNVDPSQAEAYTPSAVIIKTLRTSGDLVGGTDHAAAQRITAVLSKLGCAQIRVRENGQQIRAWRGVGARL